jgi:hypothetical protein
MATGSNRQIGKKCPLILLAAFAVVLIGLGSSGCGTMAVAMLDKTRVKTAEKVNCDNQPASSIVTEEDCEEVNKYLKEAGIIEGRVGFDLKGLGRLQLAGKYKDESQVREAFAIAQYLVGTKYVSPITPSKIQVEAWQECMKRAVSGQLANDCIQQQEAYLYDDTQPGRIEQKYALLIGVKEFKDKTIPDIGAAPNDVKHLKSYLIDKAHFPESNVKTLLNEEATLEQISLELGRLANRAKENDVVVVYLSTHGAPPDHFGRVNLIAYDTDYSGARQANRNPIEGGRAKNKLWDTSLTWEKIQSFSKEIKSKRIVFIVDACYSGDLLTVMSGQMPGDRGKFQEEEKQSVVNINLAEIASYVLGRPISSKSLHLEGQSARTITTQEKKLSVQKYDQFIPKEPRKSWGKVIIAASDADEESYFPPGAESETENSFFTKYFVKYLTEENGEVQKAFMRTAPNVSEAVKGLPTKHGQFARQHPQAAASPSASSWNFSLAAKR